MSKYNCIIVEPDMSSRMKLKQAAAQVTDFGVVTPMGTLQDGISALENGERAIDVVFVSARFESSDISQFIQQAKKARLGEDAAYVMIMKAQPQGNASLAENMIIGGDSVLCEPYSVDSLVEITRLAARVKKERQGAREKIAINLLINDIINQVDVVAHLKSAGCELGTSVKKLREMCGVLGNLTPEMRDYYYETAANSFAEAKVPPKAAATSKKYVGVSSRVRKKIGDKIVASMNKPS
jgi:DNA-binding NarL/FixJ family response regulator